MKNWRLMAAVAVVGLVFASGASAQAKPEDLIKSSGCGNCHEVATKKVGPAFKEVAAKYKGKADAQKMLVENLKAGKGHPPVKASDADLATMVKYVLAQ